MISMRKPIRTRGGNNVEIYRAFIDYMIGAYYDDNDSRWVPCTWTMPNGFFINEKKPRGLDLVNVEV